MVDVEIYINFFVFIAIIAFIAFFISLLMEFHKKIKELKKGD